MGKAIAMELASAGADVVVHCRESEEEADELAGSLRRLGVGAWVVQADFAKPDGAEGLVGKGAKASGKPLSILVNSASSFPQDPLRSMDRRQLDASISVNAWAPFVLLREFAAQAKAGCVVNIVDSHILDPERQRASYSIAKGMLADFTRMGAMELAPSIRVNAVAPGFITTAMTDALPENVKEEMKKAIPMGRFGTIEDVANAVLFFASPESAYITGQVMHVNGGMYM